ncbi:MAG: hypothetical protein ACJ0FI_05785 [Gammaproteobacteria bacterium]
MNKNIILFSILISFPILAFSHSHEDNKEDSSSEMLGYWKKEDCKNVSDAAGLYLYISGDLMTKADEAEKSGRDIKAATLYKRSLEFAEIAANHAKSFEAFCKQPS